MTVDYRIGHVLDRLRDMPDGSVHSVWTSPPYWGLRSYGTEPQVWGGDTDCAHVWGEQEVERKQRGPRGDTSTLEGTHNGRLEIANHGCWCQLCAAWRGEHGLEPSFELWLAHEVLIFREVRRVLRDDGTLWLNIGDAYAATSNGTPADQQDGDNRTFRDKPFSTATGIFKPKDRLLMPARLAIALQGDGWVLRDEVIWNKRNPMPSSVPDRTTPAHEMLYTFSKANKPVFWYHVRQRKGARKAPAPDYIWLDRAHGNAETAEEPANWRTEEFVNHLNNKVKRWRRINLWRADDYFYDGFAIAEPCSPDTHARLSQATLMGQQGGAKQAAYEASGQNKKTGSRKPADIIKGMAVKAGIATTKQDGVGKKQYSGFNQRYFGGQNYADATQSGPNSRLRTDKNGTPKPRKGTAPNLPNHRGLHTHVGLHLEGRRVANGVNPKARGDRDTNGRQNESFVSSTSGAIALTRNKRSVWDITLEPFPGAHFATAPTELVKPCILAGTSEKGVCPHCGAPWVRIIEKSGGTIGQAWHGHADNLGEGQTLDSLSLARASDGTYRVDHLGWSPTCACEANEPVPATVLDPFGGAATTGLVAARLGRRCILIEVKPDYAAIGAARLRTDLHTVAGVEQPKPTDLPLFASLGPSTERSTDPRPGLGDGEPPTGDAVLTPRPVGEPSEAAE